MQCDSLAQVCGIVSPGARGPPGCRGVRIPRGHPLVRVAALLLSALLRNLVPLQAALPASLLQEDRGWRAGTLRKVGARSIAPAAGMRGGSLSVCLSVGGCGITVMPDSQFSQRGEQGLHQN